MKQIALLFIVTISTTSCYHVYYAPNTAHSPLLSQKGETRINAYYSGGSNSDFEGAEFQGATAIGKQTGIMVNTMFVGNSETVSDYNSGNSWLETGKASYIEFAGGVFKSYGNKGKWIGEVYGGFGLGTAKNTYRSNESSKVGITKFFLQPAFGFKTNHFEVSLVPKVSFVNWKVKEEKLTAANSYDGDAFDLMQIHQNPNFLCFEPALIVRGGGKNIKLHAGLSFSNLNDNLYPVENLTSSIGISINLKPKKN